MATAAGDFLSVHLAVIVRILGISENLAGVTIFAFGNGSSDLFSTLAAMNSDNGSLAISELFGAAAFITTVVLGLVMIVQPFSVDPNTFVGNVLWFIIAATILMAFIADGYLTLSECLGIIGLYVAFVCFTVFRAKNPLSGRLAAEINDVQYHERRGEPAESVAGLSDETTPILAAESILTDARTPRAGFAEQPSCASREVRIENRPANVGILAETTAGRGLHPDSSSAASSVSGTVPEDADANQRSWTRALHIIFGPFMTSWKDQNRMERVISILSVPFLIPISLTTPRSPPDGSRDPNIHIYSEANEEIPTIAGQSGNNAGRADSNNCPSIFMLLMEQSPVRVPLILGPQFIGFVFLQQNGLLGSSTLAFLPVCLGSALLSAILIFHCTSNASQYPGNHIPSFTTSILGFTTSLTWIYLTATSAVSLLTILGMILSIPNAVLGASIFAIGNSSNDLIVNIAVARRGFPVMAASACFGGPMMNMLLGIGGGGLVQTLKNHYHNENKTKPVSFEVSPTLFVSGATLIAALMLTLGYSFCNSWKLNRGLGLVLIGCWIVTTVGIVGLSVMTS